MYKLIIGGVWPDLKLEIQNLKSLENDANIEKVSFFRNCFLKMTVFVKSGPRKVPSDFFYYLLFNKGIAIFEFLEKRKTGPSQNAKKFTDFEWLIFKNTPISATRQTI